MQITDVQIQLSAPGQDRLRAFCNIIIDDAFVIRDIKIIDGPQGPFVAMPSRKMMTNCPACHSKYHRLANYCNQCGAALPRAPEGPRGTTKLHSDIAHPINAVCRSQVQEAILQAFHKEIERAQRPGYRPQNIENAEAPHAAPRPQTPPDALSPEI